MNEKKINNNGYQLVSKYRGAIMGIAALWIYVFHAWIILSPEQQAGSFNLISFLERYIKEIGFAGVDIFFMVSGIGLTFAIKKESLPVFYYRRIRRVALPALTVGIIRGIVQNWGFAETLRIVSGYNFFMKSIYDFVWFVPSIIILYIFFPLYWKFFDKSGNKGLFTTGAILIWLTVTLLVRNTLREDFFGFTARIPIFLIGILLGYLTQKHKTAVFKAGTYVMLIIVFVNGLYLAYLTNFKQYKLIVPADNSFLPTAFIAIGLAFLTAKILEITERRLPRVGKGLVAVLAFFGSISLELYCIQWWFAPMNTLFLEDGWPPYLINILLFLLITALSWVMSILFKYFWELVEQPFKHRKAAKR